MVRNVVASSLRSRFEVVIVAAILVLGIKHSHALPNAGRS